MVLQRNVDHYFDFGIFTQAGQRGVSTKKELD